MQTPILMQGMPKDDLTRVLDRANAPQVRRCHLDDCLGPRPVSEAAFAFEDLERRPDLCPGGVVDCSLIPGRLGLARVPIQSRVETLTE
jgi:hypothetical protein